MVFKISSMKILAVLNMAITVAASVRGNVLLEGSEFWVSESESIFFWSSTRKNDETFKMFKNGKDKEAFICGIDNNSFENSVEVLKKISVADLNEEQIEFFHAPILEKQFGKTSYVLVKWNDKFTLFR
eukprot:gene829-665_t